MKISTAELERIASTLREEGVALEPPRAGAGDWVAAVFSRAAEWFDSLMPSSLSFGGLGTVIVWSLVALSALAVCLVVVHLLSRGSSLTVEHTDAEEDETPVHQDHDWRGVLRRSLETGDLTAALEATWWILLTGMHAAEPHRRPEPEQEQGATTGRHAVRASGRLDLMPLVHRLEALTYGRTELTRQEVEQLARRVEAAF